MLLYLGLFQHCIHQSCFPMIYMRNNCYIPNVSSRHQLALFPYKANKSQVAITYKEIDLLNSYSIY